MSINQLLEDLERSRDEAQLQIAQQAVSLAMLSGMGALSQLRKMSVDVQKQTIRDCDRYDQAITAIRTRGEAGLEEAAAILEDPVLH